MQPLPGTRLTNTRRVVRRSKISSSCSSSSRLFRSFLSWFLLLLSSSTLLLFSPSQVREKGRRKEGRGSRSLVSYVQQQSFKGCYLELAILHFKCRSPQLVRRISVAQVGAKVQVQVLNSHRARLKYRLWTLSCSSSVSLGISNPFETVSILHQPEIRTNFSRPSS